MIPRFSPARGVAVIAACISWSLPLRAQCADWSDVFALDGVSGIVSAQTVFDDGSGPKLYVGGTFSSAFGTPAHNIAAWDGASWTALGSGVDDAVGALFVHDDGSGAKLYVGGSFSNAGGMLSRRIARWDGTSWSSIGNASGGGASNVRALASFDDGSGAKLFAAGSFVSMNGVPCVGIARWDGVAWSALGSGLAATSGFSWGNALATFDDGSGDALYVGGQFDSAGGALGTSKIARWDGSNWSGVGGGFTGSGVFALCPYDDGSGARLYAGGFALSQAGNPINGIASWDGASWNTLYGGIAGGTAFVRALQVFDDGNGDELYVGGKFLYAVNAGASAITAPHVARWDGAQWSDVSGGVGQNSVADSVDSLAVFGGQLCAGGLFDVAGDVLTRSFGLFSGGAWHNAGGGGVLSSQVNTLLGVDNPQLGRGVFAGGAFDLSGSGSLHGIGRWDGSVWRALGSGFDNSVSALALFDDGNGNALYAGGYFDNSGSLAVNGIARWDGANWSALGTGIEGAIYAFVVHDDGSGPALYVGGSFPSAGGVAVNGLARWDGVNWLAVGPPLVYAGAGGAAVYALTVHDDGSGRALYVGGRFTDAGGSGAINLARWNGTQWSRVDTLQPSAPVRALAVYDDGSGAELYAAGFPRVGTRRVNGIARWDGQLWSTLSDVGGNAATIVALAVHPEASGSVLVAGGTFTSIGGISAAHIARWNGQAWSSLGSGVSADVSALASADDGSSPTPQLFAGGWLTSAGSHSSHYVARWSDPCACGAATTYCTAGTTSNGCVPAISGSGTPSASAASGFTISVSGVEGQKVGHVFYGVNGALANPWSPASSSFLCVKAPSQRTPSLNSGGTNGACDGSIAIDWNAFVAANPGSLGAPFSAGTRVWAQLYFRDPPAPKTTNLSNGLTFVVCP